jgi:hypothetical protein
MYVYVLVQHKSLVGHPFQQAMVTEALDVKVIQTPLSIFH